MNQKVIVLNAKCYNFVSEQGEQIEGISINYLDANYTPDSSNNSKGVPVLKLNSKNRSLIKKITSCPSVCMLDMYMMPGQKGVTKLMLNDVDFVHEFNFGKI